MSNTDITSMQQQALEIAARYRIIGARKGEKDWSARDYLSGFTKDLGDLTKLLMIKDGLRSDDTGDIEAKIEHELSDCLWSILVIANKLDIDIVESFSNTMQQLDERLKQDEPA